MGTPDNIISMDIDSTTIYPNYPNSSAYCIVLFDNNDDVIFIGTVEEYLIYLNHE